MKIVTSKTLYLDKDDITIIENFSELLSDIMSEVTEDCDECPLNCFEATGCDYCIEKLLSYMTKSNIMPEE